MIQEQKPSRVRPYWHVDAKWIAGLLFFASVSICLLFYNLSNLTERGNAVPLTAAVISNFLGGSNLTDSSGLQSFRQQAAQSKTDTIAPLSDFPGLHITKQDALTLDPAALRSLIFSQITGAIYDNGLQAAAQQLTASQTEQSQFVQQASVLGAITGDNHAQLQRLFFISAILSVLLALVVISFSVGWGRLVSPGVVLVLATPLGGIAGLILSGLSSSSGPLPASIPPSVAQTIGQSLTHSYFYTFLAGVGLLVVAFLGKTVHVFLRYNHH